jgi:high affinity Mn2+ porin
MISPTAARLHSSATLVFLALAMDDAAIAADASASTARKPADIAQPLDWSGLYFGGHVGFGRGLSNTTVSDPATIVGSNSFGGPVAGAQIGINYVLPSRLLLGLETDVTFPNYLESSGIMASVPTAARVVREHMDYVGSLRGRVGTLHGPWLLYATGGFAYAGNSVFHDIGAGDPEKRQHVRPGWAAGAGVEYAFQPQWSARLEYLYSRYADADAVFPTGIRYDSTMDFHQLRVGLNRRLDFGARASASTDAEPKSLSDSDRWELHTQATYIQQGYPAFHSLYTGPNSLTPWPQTRNTTTISAFVGVRLWEGGELYYNPELFQGFGLHDTTGAGGFPNGEAQKSNFPYPHYSTSRLYVRQTFGLGGEQETLESGLNQLSGKVDVSRLTLQVGRFPVVDYFDNNSYARDPRKDFMNWSIWASGAFDYAADKLGLGYGAIAELNQKNWALRAGYFLMDAESNSNNFDTQLFRRGEYVVELEQRYELFSRPGKLRTLAFLNSAFSGSYRETLNDPTLDLDIAQTRKGRFKYGYVFNVEQSVTDDIGVFGRWSWNDGKTEIMAFTDIDASLSLGTSIKGKAWGRDKDTVGIAGAVNALSRDHRDFIAAGGLGPLIGDGRLNYRTERVLETYYSYALRDMISLTLDYQLLVNPAYNADRGPVSIFSARLHAEF